MNKLLLIAALAFATITNAGVSPQFNTSPDGLSHLHRCAVENIGEVEVTELGPVDSLEFMFGLFYHPDYDNKTMTLCADKGE